MPIDENGTPTSSSQPGNSSQPTGSVSDLGDILMDKSLDTVEKNDFVPVSKNDVAGFGEEETDGFPQPTGETTVKMPDPNPATIEDLHNIMLDAPVVDSSSTPVVNTAADGTTEETVEEIVEEVVEEASQTATENDVNNMFDIKLDDIGTASPSPATDTTSQQSNVAEVATEETTEEDLVETDAQTPADAAAQEPTLDMSNIQLDAPAPTTEQQTPSVSTPVVEQTPVVETPKEEIVPVQEIVPAQETAPVAPTEQPTTPDTSANNTTNGIDINLDGLADMMQPEIASSEPVVAPESTISNGTTPPSEATELVDTNVVQALAEETIPTVEEVIVGNTPNSTQDNITAASSDPLPPETSSTDATISDINQTSVTTNVSNTPIVDVITPAQLSAETPAPTQPEPIIAQSPETAHLDKIAEDITQGIDLDSLVSGTTPPPVGPTTAPAEGVPASTQTPQEGLKAVFSGPAGQKKLLLVVLGGLLLVGVVFFGLQATSGPSTPSAPTAPATDESPAETPSDETPTTDIPATDVETTGNINDTPVEEEVTEDPIIDEPVAEETPAPKTADELLQQGKMLDGNIKKTSIKAALAKNDAVRKQLFQLQKEVQGVLQTLANTTDITTLEDSEKQLTSFSQRLDTLLAELNNGSSQ